MANNIEKEWYLITIFDSSFLQGKSINKIVSILQGLLNIKFVGVSDLEGAGICNLIANEKDIVIPIDEFLKKVSFVDQFDWGDFFLFSQFPNNFQTFEKKSYSEIISQTDTTVRAIDDSYIYIYTPYETVLDEIKKDYIIDEINSGQLNSLSFPF